MDTIISGTVDGRESVLARMRGATARVTFDHIGPEGRHVFAWRIAWHDETRGWVSVAGTDLSSGASGMGSDPRAMLATLGSFLGAYAEAQSYPDSENRDLFPAQLPAGIASDLSDEIALELDGFED